MGAYFAKLRNGERKKRKKLKWPQYDMKGIYLFSHKLVKTINVKT